MTQIILHVDDLPNRSTVKAIKDAKGGKVIHSNDSTDMFTSLGK